MSELSECVDGWLVGKEKSTYLSGRAGQNLNKTSTYKIGNRVLSIISRRDVCFSSPLLCNRASRPFPVFGAQIEARNGDAGWSLASWWEAWTKVALYVYSCTRVISLVALGDIVFLITMLGCSKTSKGWLIVWFVFLQFFQSKSEAEPSQTLDSQIT